MMSHDNLYQSDWAIDTEIATARHIPSGVVFRYLPVPNSPEQLRTFVITARGEYANLCNQAVQNNVKQLGEQGKALYMATLDEKQKEM